MARRSKLTPETIRTLEQLLSDGNTDKDACAAAGIHPATFYDWLKQGEQATRGKYSEFSDAVTRARATARQRAVAAIRHALVGFERKETYTERIERDGKVFEKTSIKTIQEAPDWRAAVEYLKRRDPEHWSEKINHEQHVTIEHAYESAADEFERLISRHVTAGAEAGVAGDTD